MSLQVLDIIKKGLKQTFSTTGLELIGAFYVLNILSQLVNDSLVAQGVLASTGTSNMATPLAVTAVPSAVWVALFAVALIANLWLALGALRNLVNENFESLDEDLFSENLTMPALNLLAGSIVFGVLVTLGFIALVVPGIFLLVSLLFWSIFVAVENDNFVDAMKNSWDMTKGNKIDLFLVLLGVFGVSLLALTLSAVPTILISAVNPAAGTLVSLLVSAFGTVLGITTVAHTYNQLQ